MAAIHTLCLTDAPDEVLSMSSGRLQELLSAAQRAAEVLTGPSTQTLLLLKGSKQFATRMAQQLALEAGQEGKCIAYVCRVCTCTTTFTAV